MWHNHGTSREWESTGVQRRFKLTALLAATLIFGTVGVPAEETSYKHLADLDLAELMNVEVDLVLRKQEPLFTTPSAAYVISNEKLRRTGATTLADALRIVPGINVSGMEANKWAISSRGFNGRFARHMLVLRDGRSVYNPLTSGVFWEVQDVMLADIDRIEVVRGPGGTMWGANAVNGVINVVTKKAQDTQGTLLSFGGGTEEEVFGSVRHGGRLTENAFFRVYARSFRRDAGSVNGEDGFDDWRQTSAGFRVDWEAGPDDLVSIVADAYDGRAGQLLLLPDPVDFFVPVPETVDVSGGSVLARWKRTFSDNSDVIVQAYYDRIERDEITYGEERDTADIDMQHRFALGDRQEIMWGAGFRWTGDELRASDSQWYTDNSRQDEVYSAFVQDECTLLKDYAKLVVGSKIEHNDYTDFEYQPSARLVLTPATPVAVWASVSRAVRTPSRMEHTMRLLRSLQRPNQTFFGSPVLPAIFVADDEYDSEKVLAYELGHRAQLLDNLRVDVACFLNRYHDLQSVEPVGIDEPVPFVLRNNLNGEAYGVEVTVQWQPTGWWRLEGSYAYMRLDLEVDPGSRDIFTEETFENDIPENHANILSSLNLPYNCELNTWLRYTDRNIIEDLDQYIELDVNATWYAGDYLELALVGRNLLDSHHYEYGPSFLLTTQSTEVDRSFYARATVRF